METLLIGGLVKWGAWKYLLLFIAMFLQGDVTLFAAAFLIEQGMFEMLPALLIIFFETMFGDVLYYLLGRSFKDSKFLPFRIINKISKPVDRHLQKYLLHTLILSKYTVGMHRAVVYRVGAIGAPFKKFLKINLLASTLWIAGVGTLGYLSGAYFELIRQYVRYAEVGLLLALIAFIAISHLLVKKTEESLSHEEKPKVL